MAKSLKGKFLNNLSVDGVRIRIRFVGKQSDLFRYYKINYGGSTSFESRRFFYKKYDNGDKSYARTKRVVSLVIDRADESIKAFACPISVWYQLDGHSKENDFEIWREGKALQTKYYAKALGTTEITEEQERIVDATLESFTFEDIFVDNDWELVNEVVERIESRLDILDL